MDERVVDIATLDESGAGRAADVRVPGAVPGDRARVRLVHFHSQRRFWEGELVALEARGPERRASLPCPIWRADCACPLMPASDALQAIHKRELLVRALAEHPRTRGLAVEPTVSALEREAYRSKIVLVVAPRPGGVLLGGYRRGSHEVLDLSGCVIEEPVLRRAAQWLRSRLPVTLELRYVVMRSTHAGRALISWIGRGEPPAWAPPLAEALRQELPEIEGISWARNDSAGNAIWQGEPSPLSGEARLLESSGELDFAISPETFFQVHRAQAERLRARLSGELAAALGTLEGARVWDLFCGVGVNALAFARAGARVLGAESHATAIDDATANALRNRLPATFVRSDLARWPDHPEFSEPAAAVVLNPPRKGASADLVHWIGERAPRVIAYVACAPKPLASALSHWLGLGYEMHALVPFDLFPHTEHVETLAVLHSTPPR